MEGKWELMRVPGVGIRNLYFYAEINVLYLVQPGHVLITGS